MNCSECGSESPDSARFCVGCGRALPRCAACAAAVAPHYHFCPGCGRPLTPASAVPDDTPGPDRTRSEHDHPGLPAAVAPHSTVAADRPQSPQSAIRNPRSAIPPASTHEQERRQVAILFADIVGFTALSERLGPETVHEIVQHCLTSLAEVVVEHGGHVDKFIGDCIMALFGAPTAHEDDVPRAVTAALAMQARLQTMNVSLQREHRVELSLRVGVNAGLVVAGELGRAGDYTVVGDAVNVASRIQGLARPGTVVVTAPVRALADGAFTFIAVGSVTVRNRATPVDLYEVAGIETTPESWITPALSPFVGRERELEQLQAALEEARHGWGSAIWIVAEAGMGKSRLIREFAATAAPGLLVLTGHCRGYAAPLYLPLRHWWEQLAAIDDMGAASGKQSDGDSEREETRRGGKRSDGFDDWARLLSCPDDLDCLRRMLYPERAGPEPLDPQTAKHVAHRALVQLLSAVSRQLPLLLVVEDLHWADALSLELLELLAREIVESGRREDNPLAPSPRPPVPPSRNAPSPERLPLLLVGTTRPDAVGSRQGVELSLGPLEADALWDLLNGLLAPHVVSQDAARWLIAATHGNPFFLEELAQSLQASGDLVLRDGRWELARSLADLRVPDTVRGVVQARIDALDPIARLVVREAAVLGTSFDTRVLRAMTSASVGLEEALEALERVRILAPADEYRAAEPAPSSPRPEPSPLRSFHQTVIQQVAYDSLLVRRRRELHERAAREIEALYQGRESEVVEDLAEHYTRAEVPGPAILYLGEAAARAQSLYANDRARVLYNRLLELVARLPHEEAAAHAESVFKAECGLADLEALEGDTDAAVSRLRRLLPTSDDASPHHPSPVSVAALRRRLGMLLFRRGEPEEAEAELAAALALVEGLTSPEAHRETARAWYQRAALEYRRGQYPGAEAALCESDRHAVMAADAALQADCLLLRGLVHYDTGQRREARAVLGEALRRKEAVGDLRGMAAALNNLGNLATDEGRFADARADFSRALELRRRIGHREGIAAVEINLGNVALSLGEWEAAQRHLETAQALCEEIGDAYGALAAATNRGRLALEKGHARDARRRLTSALERARRLEFTNLAVDAQIALAEAEVALNEPEKAAATAAAAGEAAAGSGDPMLIAAATRAAAMAAAAEGRSLAAETDFAASRRAFRDLGQPLEEARTLVRWAASLDAAERAHSLLAEAEALAQNLGAAGELTRIHALRAARALPPPAKRKPERLNA